MSAAAARRLRVSGVVQGVGFRPFVYRLARRNELAGWVRNGAHGVEIHLEGAPSAIERFVRGLGDPPPAASLCEVEQEEALPLGLDGFEIDATARDDRPTVRVSPDLPVCDACLRELFDPADRRFRYPYVNCTDCGPRYSIVLGLPYDRPLTTMREWPLCAACAAEYEDPADRRFHAQPTACRGCGPAYVLWRGGGVEARGDEALAAAVAALARGDVVAVKGIGGYHLACDARNAGAVHRLRTRKARREKPFALLVRDLAVARRLVALEVAHEHLLASPARPIVIAEARAEGLALRGVAPDQGDLGVMLPYAPLHHLLFAGGAPEILVLTSANRSSEPIAYRDDDALERLGGLADAFLVGERAIARRVDDSVVTVSALAPLFLRRSRGYAPGSVARLPSSEPVLAVGGDLKNAIALLVDGEIYASQHVGDLEQHEASVAHRQTIEDLLAMYRVEPAELTVAHDLHPEYRSTLLARELPARRTVAVQHHRAHVASVLAERACFDRRVIGVAFDGTGYGDDGTIWGGEFFAGSLADGFDRVAHLAPAWLPGGDAAARHPAQAAAGFLYELQQDSADFPDLGRPPFSLPERAFAARRLIERGVRTIRTTSVGRLFDAAAALLGFVRASTFEGQAAVWLEQLARSSTTTPPLGFRFRDRLLEHRPALEELVRRRARGGDPRELARAFHCGLAGGIAAAVRELAEQERVDTVVLCGGVFQNRLLVELLARALAGDRLELWLPRALPPNDGGLALGQAALAVFRPDELNSGARGARC